MAMSNAQDLLKHELGDLLFAEKTILKGLKKMTREVSHPDMRQRMEAHQGETEQQILAQEEAMAKFLEAQAPGALASISAEVEGEAGAGMEPAVEPEVARSRGQSRPASGSTRPTTGRSATAGR